MLKSFRRHICTDSWASWAPARYFRFKTTTLVPGTLNNHFLMDGNGDFQPDHFLCKDLVHHHPIDSQPFIQMDGRVRSQVGICLSEITSGLGLDLTSSTESFTPPTKKQLRLFGHNFLGGTKKHPRFPGLRYDFLGGSKSS